MYEFDAKVRVFTREEDVKAFVKRLEEQDAEVMLFPIDMDAGVTLVVHVDGERAAKLDMLLGELTG